MGSATLPIILNQQKEIVSIACSGNVKEMCSLMITQNKSIKDVMFVDKASKNTVFHSICELGHLELLLFLESLMDRKQFIEYIFLPNTRYCPIEFAVRYSHSSMIRHFFSMNEVQQRFKGNEPMIFRLCIFLFARNSNLDNIKYVLSALQIDKEKIIKMLSYSCPESKMIGSYHKVKIITSVLWIGTFDNLKRLIDFVGEQAFIGNVFNVDKYNQDAMRWAVDKKKMNVIKYILSINQIKKKYLSDNNSLHYLCQTLNKFIANKEAVKYVVDTLDLREAKLSELNTFRQIDIDKILPFTK